jgi:hypothetical protein
MPKIVGFGDSFVFGSEIANNDDGSCAWPALAAGMIGADYETLADPGCGNDAIARQIYHYFSSNPVAGTLAIVNWTWTMRWDFYMTEKETWITLGPTCVPEKLEHLVEHTEAQRVVEFYRDYANGSLLWNKIRNLQTIWAATQYMASKGVQVIQTYMDPELFSQEWHAPSYVRELQGLVHAHMHTWEGMNFLDWCRARGHDITPDKLHPLAAAHEDAAYFWKDQYAVALAKMGHNHPKATKVDQYINKDGSRVIDVVLGKITFLQWGMSLPEDEKGEFLRVYTQHEDFVQAAEQAGDMERTIIENRHTLVWKSADIHSKWIATVPAADHKKYLDYHRRYQEQIKS